MLATLIDMQLTERGLTRRCFVDSLGVRDVDATLKRFDRLLNEGTSNEQWLRRLAEKLGLDMGKMIRANRVTMLMQKHRKSDGRGYAPVFTPHIEFVLENISEPNTVMQLARDLWQFKLPPLESLDAPVRDFASARRLYKQKFIAARGRCFGHRVDGFRYYWAKDQALEFDVYGLVKVIVPHHEPPKKRFVSRHVLRAVGKPTLLVIHNR